MEEELDKKQLLLATIKDAVACIFYYDRKDDEELTEFDIDKLIDEQDISLKEIVDTFTAEILENFPHIKVV